MKKQEQIHVNNECVKAVEKFNACLDTPKNIQRLDSCSACTFEQGNYIVLRSYSTVIAFIDRETGILYDILRNVYGYTATSAKHVAKFRNYFSHSKELTYKNV